MKSVGLKLKILQKLLTQIKTEIEAETQKCWFTEASLILITIK